MTTLTDAIKTDNVKHYTRWAVEQGYAVIDVNIPKYLTCIEDDHEYAEGIDSDQKLKETKLLAKYLWDNYIE